jgi:hypothetical protein
MRRLFLFAAAFAFAAPAAAQDWRTAPEYDVLLTAYDIQPGEIRLQADRPVRLRFVNTSNIPLRFSAKKFFKSAQLRNRDGSVVQDGMISVQPLATETVVLVPKAGRYKTGGGTYVLRRLGMRGRIVVQ